MAATQQEILAVLLRALLDRHLIPQSVYDSALGMIRSGVDVPAFFRERECRREEELDGYPQNPE